jgi:queuine tRNA-ribosyltransferase
MLTDAGRLNLKNARFAADDGPLDPACGCIVCGRWSRAYLRHLLMVQEPTAPRLLTLHNVAWTLALVARMRASIRLGRFDGFRSEVLAVWG